jgi:hypothetical protein
LSTRGEKVQTTSTTRGKSESVTFRIESEALRNLRREAGQKDISTNTLVNKFADILRMFQPSLKLTYFFIPSCPTLLPFFLMNDGALIY